MSKTLLKQKPCKSSLHTATNPTATAASYSLFIPCAAQDTLNLERVMGVEPTSSAWKAEVIAIIRHPLNKPFLPAAHFKIYWRGRIITGFMPSALRVVAKNATLEIAPGNFPEPLIGSNPPLSPEGVFNHFSAACTYLVQIMVEGGGLLRAPCPHPTGRCEKRNAGNCSRQFPRTSYRFEPSLITRRSF